MGPHSQNHAVVYNILAPCQLCVPLVYKGIGMSCCVTGSFWQRGLSHPRIKACQAFPGLHEFSSICSNPQWTCPALTDCKTALLIKYLFLFAALPGCFSLPCLPNHWFSPLLHLTYCLFLQVYYLFQIVHSLFLTGPFLCFLCLFNAIENSIIILIIITLNSIW